MAKNKYYTHVATRFDEIKKWCKRGATDKEIIKLLGISKQSFYLYMQKYTDFSDLIKKNRINAVEEIKNALFKRAVGFQYNEKKIIKGVNEDGEESEKTEVTTKTVVPDPVSCIILLKHWAKEEGWTNDPQLLELKKQELNIKKQRLDNENW